MKLNRIVFTWALAIFATCAVISCKKDGTDNGTSNSTGNGGSNNGGTDTTDTVSTDTVPSIRCTINGTAFVSDTVIITEADGLRIYTGIRGNRRIIIATSDSLPGTYALGSSDPTVSYQSGSTVFGPAFSDTGTLIIAQKDSIGMDGTFVANVQDILVTGQTINLPDGQFFNLPLH